MENNSLDTILLTELGQLLRPLSSLDSPEKVLALLRQLGWESPAPNLDLDLTSLANLPSLIEKVENAEDAPALTEAIPELFKQVKEILGMIDGLTSRVEQKFAAYQDFLNSSGIKENYELPRRLIDYLIITYIEKRSFKARSVLLAMGLIESEDQPAIQAKYQPAFTLNRIRWERFPKLFADPRGVFADVYEWGDSTFNADLLLERLAIVLRAFAVPGGLYPVEEDRLAALDVLSVGRTDVKELRIPLWTDGVWPQTYVEFGTALARASEAGMPPGLALLPYLLGSNAGNFSLRDYREITYLNYSPFGKME